MLGFRDVKILALVNREDKINPYSSVSLDEIYNLYTENSNHENIVAKSTIRLCILNLIKDGLLEYGFKRSNIKTYYVSEKGLEFLATIEQNKNKK